MRDLLPVLHAEPDRRRTELVELLGCNPSDVLQVSAKEGVGVPELLEEIVHRVPAPKGDPNAPPRAPLYAARAASSDR